MRVILLILVLGFALQGVGQVIKHPKYEAGHDNYDIASIRLDKYYVLVKFIRKCPDKTGSGEELRSCCLSCKHLDPYMKDEEGRKYKNASLGCPIEKQCIDGGTEQEFIFKFHKPSSKVKKVDIALIDNEDITVRFMGVVLPKAKK